MDKIESKTCKKEISAICLSLKRREDRRILFSRDWPLDDMPFQFFDAIDGKKIKKQKIQKLQKKQQSITAANYAIRVSKRMILRNFLKTDKKFLLFMQDDCVFVKQFVNDFQFFLNHSNFQFDVMFFGGQRPYTQQMRNKQNPIIQQNGRLIRKMHPSPDHHCLLFSRRGAKKILKHYKYLWHGYDDQQMKMLIHNKQMQAYWMGRFSAFQRAGIQGDNYWKR